MALDHHRRCGERLQALDPATADEACHLPLATGVFIAVANDRPPHVARRATQPRGDRAVGDARAGSRRPRAQLPDVRAGGPVLIVEATPARSRARPLCDDGAPARCHGYLWRDLTRSDTTHEGTGRAHG